MTAVRALLLACLLVAAVALQVAVFSALSYDGVVPNLALHGGVEVFSHGLAPPADHIAGRWALALVVVGYLAGRVRHDAGTSALTAVLTVAACSFVGTSIFALSGMLLRDPSIPVGEALRVIPVAVVYDVLLTPLVLPLLMRLFRRLQPQRVAY